MRSNSESMGDCNMNKMFKAYQDAVGQKITAANVEKLCKESFFQTGNH